MTEQIEGRHPVREALASGRAIRKVLVARTGREAGSLREIVHLARRRRVTVQEVDPRWLDRMARTRAHQGVIALAGARATVDPDDLLAAARQRGEAPLVVLLDGIEDPQNVGAIIRVAEAAGAHGMILPARRSSGLTPAVARASAGAIEHLPVAVVTNLTRTIDGLKRAGLWVIGADLGGEDLYGTELAPPLAVVIGNEGRGLSRLVRESCDRLVRVPMRGRVASLNAATAAAVVLFEIGRRQGQGAGR
ncbi:MAG: 23S rRNA (guanosine(2251)-2'-O)-methyltransferase RlmB [Armatimonadetes bacterium]|nr:23S rRNA (guanosine(2251)-2'-O)-methyltransferase RlmB [Armatimonadota bacterium]